MTFAKIVHHNAYMRTTLNIDASLLRRAARLTGVSKKTAPVRLGLEALAARESARRLAKLGGSEPHLRPIRRPRCMTLVDTSVWIDHRRRILDA